MLPRPVLSIVATAATAALSVSVVARASPRWRPPTQLSPTGIALGPRLALEATGEALVVWDHEVGAVCADQPANPACVHVVEAVGRASPAAAWSQPVEIARPGVDSRPQVALDPRGDAVAVWVHDIGDDRVLQAAYRAGRAGAWPEPVDLSEVTRRIRAFGVALDAAGIAIVAWAGTDSGGKTVVFAKERSAATGVWGGQIALSRADGDAPGGPSLAVNAEGDAVVVWTQSEAGGRVVQASYRAVSSGVWSAPSTLSGPGADIDADVAVDAAGDAVAVWSRAAIEAAFRPAGAAWGPAAAVSTSLPQKGDPDVGLDPGGNAVAVWLSAGVVRAAARSRSTAGWSAPDDVSNAGSTPARVAVDQRGNAVAAWIDVGRTARAALRPAATGRWLAATAVAPTGGATSELQVGVDGVGNALAVWNRGDSRDALVDAAALEASGPVLDGLAVPTRGAARVAVGFAVEPAPWAAPLTGQPLWSFGDGSSATGARVSHVYQHAGRFAVSVTQADAAGGTASATATITIAAPALRNTVRPSIRGRPRVGATLTCLRGQWSGTPPIRYAYRWLRARTGIPGATSERYRVRPRDAGARLACRVTARNAAGSKTATSQAVRVRR